jgi:splicing suppressor protein 51
LQQVCIYGGAAGGRVGFQHFLRLAEVKGLNNAPWNSLAMKVTKSELIERNVDGVMPMQLRLFGEQVYGRRPGVQKGDMIIMMQMQAEKLGGLVSSVLNVASRFNL